MKYLITLLTYISISIAVDGIIDGVTYFDINDSIAFNFERQYFSYKGETADNLRYNVVFDVGRTDEVCVVDNDGKKKCEDFQFKF